MSTQKIPQIPTQAKVGMNNMPTVPVPTAGERLDTLFKLLRRGEEIKPALNGLTNTYSIGGTEATSYQFLFGESAANPLTQAVDEIRTLAEKIAPDLIQQIPEPGQGSSSQAVKVFPISPRPLDQPEQFSISWTNYAGVDKDALPRLPLWASSLTSSEIATREFWPTIANYGVGYNLLFLEQVTAAKAAEFKALFGAAWSSAAMDVMQAANRLYAIDLRIFEQFPGTAGSPPRFTPGTLTLLEQDASTKKLSPVAVRVSSQGKVVVYSPGGSSSGAWLYALQAAKTSATVYGIWLGHVYHWHIVTAAMQMTFRNNIRAGHAIYQLLQPQSNYLIGFDGVLLEQWSIAPPTSFDNPTKFLQLTDLFATGRNFFDDDPKVTIVRQGLNEQQFTRTSPWDLYPLAQQLLQIWNAVERMVKVFVDVTYNSDKAVADDQPLQAWMKASAAPSPSGGNIRGLPVMNTREALKNVLTSLIFRVTVHGISRLNNSINPVLTFMANYPPCLQSVELPRPDAPLSTAALLKMLPWTNTMGEHLRFYFIFVFSQPYVPLIPPGGVDKDLPFPGGPEEPRNQAVVIFRKSMISFIRGYEPTAPQLEQWPLNIET